MEDGKYSKRIELDLHQGNQSDTLGKTTLVSPEMIKNIKFEVVAKGNSRK